MAKKQMSVAGKVILVTGATSGIGEAFARTAAERGAKVMLLGRRAENGDAIVADIREQTGNKDVAFRRCDVSDDDSIKTAVQATVDAFGRLDCAFNNAGVSASVVGAGRGIEEKVRTREMVHF